MQMCTVCLGYSEIGFETRHEGKYEWYVSTYIYVTYVSNDMHNNVIHIINWLRMKWKYNYTYIYRSGSQAWLWSNCEGVVYHY